MPPGGMRTAYMQLCLSVNRREAEIDEFKKAESEGNLHPPLATEPQERDSALATSWRVWFKRHCIAPLSELAYAR